MVGNLTSLMEAPAAGRTRPTRFQGDSTMGHVQDTEGLSSQPSPLSTPVMHKPTTPRFQGDSTMGHVQDKEGLSSQPTPLSTLVKHKPATPCFQGDSTTGHVQDTEGVKQPARPPFHSHEAQARDPSLEAWQAQLPASSWQPPKATEWLTLIGGRKKLIFHGYLETSEKTK